MPPPPPSPPDATGGADDGSSSNASSTSALEGDAELAELTGSGDSSSTFVVGGLIAAALVAGVCLVMYKKNSSAGRGQPVTGRIRVNASEERKANGGVECGGQGVSTASVANPFYDDADVDDDFTFDGETTARGLQKGHGKPAPAPISYDQNFGSTMGSPPYSPTMGSTTVLEDKL